ncbi:MAG: ATP-binding protein [Acidimicrobiales bacterium]
MSRLLSMKAKVAVFVAISTLTLVGLAVTSLLTFNTVKVGGDAYHEVLDSEKLIADVLPPPAFIVESYLTVQELAYNTDPNMESVLRWRLADLKAAYDERQEFYVEAVTDPDLTRTLKGDSQDSARQFYKVVEEQFLPAIDAGDMATAQSLTNNELRAAYEDHRTAIERVVVLASEDVQQAEFRAEGLVETRSNQLVVAVAVAVATTVLAGALVALSIIRPVRKVVHTATVTLPAMVERIRESGDATISADELGETGNDELGEATRAFNAVIMETVEMARAQADLRRAAQDNFVNLGRRSQNLLSRQIQLIESAEKGEDDPQVLDTLFKIDHLAARMRRNAESLLVLADRQPLRKRRGPVPLDDVLRAAASEIEQYQRVKIGEGDGVDLDGQYAPELVHLFAELLENAVRNSSPDTEVTVTAALTSDGCTVAVNDKGIGLGADELAEANRRLTGQVQVNEATKLGHFVVGRLAARLGAEVRLESRDGGGLAAVIVLPNELLSGGDELDRNDRLALGRKLDRAPAAVEPAHADADADADTDTEMDDEIGATPERVAALGPEPVLEEVTIAAARASEHPSTPPVVEPSPDVAAGVAASATSAATSAATSDPSSLAESFGLRKRQSGSSLAKTQRSGNRSTDGSGRNAESVRDRFSSFAAGRQQATQNPLSAGSPTPTDEETN